MKFYSLSFKKGDLVVGVLFIGIVAGLVYKGVYSMAQAHSPFKTDYQLFK